MAGSRNTNRTRAQKRRLTILSSLQVSPLGSATLETIQKTTRASHVKPMTIQRNEPDSVEREQESHLKIPRNVRRTRASIFPQQASDLLTSTRWHTQPLPPPDHSRTALDQISTSLRAYSQSVSGTLLGNSLGGPFPNRSSEPQRLSSGAMDHPTSCQLESSTHHSQAFNSRNRLSQSGMKPFRQERLSSYERSQCNTARYISYELTEVVTICIHCQLKIAVNYYPNTDRMKTTVQYLPQVTPEGWLRT